jgi:hypothetical protein
VQDYSQQRLQLPEGAGTFTTKLDLKKLMFDYTHKTVFGT